MTAARNQIVTGRPPACYGRAVKDSAMPKPNTAATAADSVEATPQGKPAPRGRPMSAAAKHRRIAELLSDIRTGLDQLSRGTEALRSKIS